MATDDRTAMVTGAAGALGRAVCRGFLERGARVYGSYIIDRELDTLPEDLKGHERLTMTKVDLSDEAAVAAWFATPDRIDILANIAGGFDMGPFKDTSTETWRRMLDMNLTTAFLCSREALRRFDAGRGGRIVNVGAFAVWDVVGGMTAYAVSKAAVVHMTEALAEETRRDNVTVNAIMPTIMDTPANRAAMPDADFSKWVPLQDAARAVLRLSAEDAGFVTGACVPLRDRT